MVYDLIESQAICKLSVDCFVEHHLFQNHVWWANDDQTN